MPPKRKKGSGSPPRERDPRDVSRVRAAIAAEFAVHSQFAGPSEDDFLRMGQRGNARKKAANPTPEAFKALTTRLLLQAPCVFIPAESGKHMLDAFEDASKKCSEQVTQMALCWQKEIFVVAQGAEVSHDEFAAQAAVVLNNYIQAALEDPSNFTASSLDDIFPFKSADDDKTDCVHASRTIVQPEQLIMLVMVYCTEMEVTKAEECLATRKTRAIVLQWWRLQLLKLKANSVKHYRQLHEKMMASDKRAFILLVDELAKVLEENVNYPHFDYVCGQYDGMQLASSMMDTMLEPAESSETQFIKKNRFLMGAGDHIWDKSAIEGLPVQFTEQLALERRDAEKMKRLHRIEVRDDFDPDIERFEDRGSYMPEADMEGVESPQARKERLKKKKKAIKKQVAGKSKADADADDDDDDNDKGKGKADVDDDESSEGEPELEEACAAGIVMDSLLSAKDRRLVPAKREHCCPGCQKDIQNVALCSGCHVAYHVGCFVEEGDYQMFDPLKRLQCKRCLREGQKIAIDDLLGEGSDEDHVEMDAVPEFRQDIEQHGMRAIIQENRTKDAKIRYYRYREEKFLAINQKLMAHMQQLDPAFAAEMKNEQIKVKQEAESALDSAKDAAANAGTAAQVVEVNEDSEPVASGSGSRAATGGTGGSFRLKQKKPDGGADGAGGSGGAAAGGSRSGAAARSAADYRCHMIQHDMCMEDPDDLVQWYARRRCTRQKCSAVVNQKGMYLCETCKAASEQGK